ncbi:hypothetical protein DPMN_127130 [Dreissena polymorpha]|uniref:Uncharacterized protein n=1 Tax=Dreissena polymorpha TaxID=45954 RepID=A0A9D4GX43_DREPO|nr:hypothetical protein DPMN_127130 [Dreissena polymorpha]
MEVTVFFNMSGVVVRLLILQWICTRCFVASVNADDAKNQILKLLETAGHHKTICPGERKHRGQGESNSEVSCS